MEKLSFEQSIARLEEIVKMLESGRAPLDESMKLYEEGIALVRACGDELDRAEAKISVLQKGSDGEMTAVPFDTQNTDN